ncbi:MAG: cyanophycinase [Deltaproteobacteria bacterium]|nr:cyanophycinase [Deltaproteobacteria bacterium]
MGILLLEGGCEFQGKMEEPDKKALKLAGGTKAKVVIIPTAAAPDDNSRQACNTAIKWFRTLGARNISALPIIDKESANDPELSAQLDRSNLIYILGGFPGYLDHTLKESRCLDALWRAYDKGAVIAGSSAGAMVLCEWYFDPVYKKIKKGFGIKKDVILIPHHDTFGRSWRSLYFDKISDIRCIGIDEQTGMIDQAHRHRWKVYGKGGVTLYRKTSIVSYQTGQTFRF